MHVLRLAENNIAEKPKNQAAQVAMVGQEPSWKQAQHLALLPLRPGVEHALSLLPTWMAASVIKSCAPCVLQTLGGAGRT